MTAANTEAVLAEKVCIVCGSPARNMACDLIEVPGSSFDAPQIAQKGPWRFGCENHPQRRTIRRLNGIVESN